MARAVGINTTHPIDTLAFERVAGLVGRSIRAALAGSKLTLDQWQVIDHLATVQQAAMSSVSAFTLIPGPSLTRTVDLLVDAALVHRTVDPHDRRRIVVRLSERGIKTHRKLAPSVSAALDHAFSPLDPAELWALRTVLTKLGG